MVLLHIVCKPRIIFIKDHVVIAWYCWSWSSISCIYFFRNIDKYKNYQIDQIIDLLLNYLSIDISIDISLVFFFFFFNLDPPKQYWIVPCDGKWTAILFSTSLTLLSFDRVIIKSWKFKIQKKKLYSWISCTIGRVD